MTNAKKDNHLPYILLLIASLGWSLMYIFIKQVSEVVHVLNISFARYLFACLFLLPFVLGKLKKIEKNELWPIIIWTLSNAGLATIVNVWATKLSTAGNVSIIVNANPLLIIILAPFLIKEKNNWLTKLGGLIGFIGLYLVIFQGFNFGSLFSSQYFIGNSLALLSTSLIGLSTIYLKKYIQKYGALTITAISFLGSFLLLLAIVCFSGEITHFPLTKFNLILPLILFGTISTIIPFLAFNYGIEKIGVNRAGIYKMLIPILTAIFAWIFLSETITNYTIIGMCFTIIGIYLVNSKNKISYEI